jgi:uncharacterized protein (DUF433 family)
MTRSRENSDTVRNIVESNPAIMGGTPVFRGTRIPVHLVAEMIEQGTLIVEILEGYPSLTREMVEYARISATTHPHPDRSPIQPWSGTTPVGRKKGKLCLVT